MKNWIVVRGLGSAEPQLLSVSPKSALDTTCTGYLIKQAYSRQKVRELRSNSYVLKFESIFAKKTNHTQQNGDINYLHVWALCTGANKIKQELPAASVALVLIFSRCKYILGCLWQTSPKMVSIFFASRNLNSYARLLNMVTTDQI